jgi:hypothetical protein
MRIAAPPFLKIYFTIYYTREQGLFAGKQAVCENKERKIKNLLTILFL